MRFELREILHRMGEKEALARVRALAEHGDPQKVYPHG